MGVQASRVPCIFQFSNETRLEDILNEARACPRDAHAQHTQPRA